VQANKEQLVAALDAAHDNYQQAVERLAQALEALGDTAKADAADMRGSGKGASYLIAICRRRFIDPPAVVIDDSDPDWERTV